jgi:hypothetical protein
MAKRTHTSVMPQTREQRQSQDEQTRRHDAAAAAWCNVLEFWRRCSERACKRRHVCAGDPHECFRRQWALYREDQKVWIREGFKARAEGHPPAEAVRIADAERARYLALTARLAAPASPPAPAKREGAAIPPRVRSM